MSAQIGVAPRRAWMRLLPTLAVFLSFTIGSFARYPVPAPNEPHYLAKAKHYWEPSWCAGDIFLSSSNAHLVFYQTFGLLTRVFSLDTTAVIGRLIGLLVLAAGWTAMVQAIVPGRWPALWAAWIFMGLSAVGSLSGEWLVGGIESKVVTYGLLFGAVAIWLSRPFRRNEWSIITAGVLAGVGISFHPVVGLWGTAAALFAIIAKSRKRTLSAINRAPAWSYAAAALALVITATPGILAGLMAASGSSAGADYIQVYYRLAHHLDPYHFERMAWIGYGVLLVFWLAARPWMSRREHERWFFWFVVGSGLIALLGLVDGWRSGPPEHMREYALRWKFLKLYPFRLFDALLPIAVAITMAGLGRRWCEKACSTHPNRRTVPVIWVLCGIPALVAVLIRPPDAGPPVTDEELKDWLAMCQWVEQNTPPDSLVQVEPPQESWAFKWFAQRPEFVSYKDCPQDGPGIIEWNNRLLFLSAWSDKNFPTGFSQKIAAPLAAKGIKYLIVRKLGPFDFEPVYRNDTFRVYKLLPARPFPD